MIYRLFELVRFLGLKPGLFEQPGNDTPLGTVGADHDQTPPTFNDGSTPVRYTTAKHSNSKH